MTALAALFQFVQRYLTPTLEQPSQIYYPLNTEEGEIRLIVLFPGAATDGITASFHTASLWQCPPCTALSYVWGDEKVRESITVNNVETTITKNLATALRNLRDEKEELLLWVRSSVNIFPHCF